MQTTERRVQPTGHSQSTLAITILNIKAMLTFKHDLVCLEPVSFLPGTLISLE